MAILISKYKTGIDFPPLTSGLTHVSGENTLTFPYKSGDSQERFSGVAGVHMLLINGGSLLLTDDTDTFTVAFGSSNITVTWLSQKYNLRDIDDVVFVFNAFAKPTSGVTRLIYTATAGQTVFTGNDTNGTDLSFDNDAVMVFQNDNYLETTDYTTSSGTTVTLGAGATNGDKISIITFDSVTDQTALNNAVTSATASATDAGQHRTTSQRWAVEADTASVVDADTGVDSNEYSSKAYAVGSNTPGGSSKDWASKTGSPVAGGEYSAKYWATSTPVTNVSTNIAAVTTVSTNIADVNTLNTNMTDIQTVADEIDNNKLQTVANNIASVVTAANDLNETTSEIDTVANSITNVDNVGGSIANVNSVAGQISPTNNISTVAGATTNIATTATNISSVNSVATNIANVNTVAGLQSDISTAITNTNQFNDTYHGPSSTAPSGSNVSVGDLWFDTTTPATMKVYNGSGWVNAGSAVNGTTNRQVYTVGTSSGSYSGSNGTFPITYDAGFIDVFLNGVKLVNGSDFTATNGTSVVLASAAATNDIVDIISYGTFNLNNTDVGDLNDVDTTGVSNGQVLSYNNTSGNFEPATIDLTSRLAVAGGQMTGNITMSGSQTVDGRDLSVDGAKLDGIEASADVTDTANVVAALTAGTGISIAGNGTIANTASTDLVSDTSPQLGGDLQTNGNDIDFGDNDEAVFGSGTDLRIYHNASNGNSHITESGSGSLVINGDNLYLQNTAGTENYIAAVSNDAVTLYHDNSAKIATTSSGVTVTGDVLPEANATRSLGSNSLRYSNLYAESARARYFYNPDDTNTYIEFPENDSIKFFANGGQKAVIQGDGKFRLNATANQVTGYELFTCNGSAGFKSDQTNVVGMWQTSSSGHFIQFFGGSGAAGCGNIGFINNNNLIISNDADNSGLQFGSGSITPAYDGAGQDNSVDLGSSSTRFQNGWFANVIYSHYLRGHNDTDTGIDIGDNGSTANTITFITGGSEKLRILSDGRIVKNRTTAIAGADITHEYNSNNGPGLLIHSTDTSGNAHDQVHFRRNNSKVGSISTTGSGTTYNTTSDIRLKTDIEPIDHATDMLMAMNPVSHRWKADPDADAVVGFIAQEMQEIVPEAVSTGDDDDAMMGMDYGRITPVIVAALQDAHRKIEQLEQRIAEMEAK